MKKYLTIVKIHLKCCSELNEKKKEKLKVAHTLLFINYFVGGGSGGFLSYWEFSFFNSFSYTGLDLSLSFFIKKLINKSIVLVLIVQQ